MLDTGLKDKVAIVTGANHGIGAAKNLNKARIFYVDSNEMEKFFCIPMRAVYRYTNS